jgi:CDP-diacylglycerol--glycerol-3-phosphate 3-phosphatidyltransferase
LSEKSSGITGLAQAAVDGKWLNPANLMTALRVALAPLIILFLLDSSLRPFGISNTLAAGILFFLAALTDKADGYYARKNDAVTKLGEFLDPLADKLLMIPVMITLWYVGWNSHTVLLPLWVVLLVVVRELLISGVRIVGARKGISFPASWSGKIKMFSQIIVVSILIFFPASADSAFVQVCVYIMAAITAYSGVDYMVRASREVFGQPAGEDGRQPGADTDEDSEVAAQ